MVRRAVVDPSFERILLATDGAPRTSGGRHGSTDTVELGLELAEVHGASLHALSVVERRTSLGHCDPVVERREAEGELAVEAADDRDRERGVPVTEAFRYGIPHGTIRQDARDDVDLIVVGAIATAGIERPTGPKSVTEHLVDDTPSPVVVAGEREHAS